MFSLLVTGSSGYLGSSFIKSCAEKYRISRFSLQSQRLEDIDFQSLDAVLHCAGIVHKGHSASADEYRRINVEYPMHLAQLAKSNGVKQFVFISSVSVYGSTEYIDDTSVCKPSSMYGHSKFEAEQRLLDLNDEELSVSILRIPMVYGPQAPGNIKSITRLVTYLPIIPLGNISNKRSFISIQNLVYSIHQVLRQKKGGIFLLADDEHISTSSLIKILLKSSKQKKILFDSRTIKSFVRHLSPATYDKLWGDLVINSSVSKRDLRLDLPIDVEAGIADILKLKS